MSNGIGIALGRPYQWTRVGGVSVPSSVVGFLGYAGLIYLIGLLSYLYLTGKRQGVGRAAWGYVRENALDWAWVTVYHLGLIVPPLRKYAEPPEPLEGATAEEIEADEDAGGMGGGDGKLAAAIGANLGLGLAVESWFFAIFLGAVSGVLVLARRQRAIGERTAVPFGPSMAVGALLALFFGRSLWNWYARHLVP